MCCFMQVELNARYSSGRAKLKAAGFPEDLIRSLGESSFVVVPLYSPDKSLGVMIVDNFVTRDANFH